jgi:predicted ATPase
MIDSIEIKNFKSLKSSGQLTLKHVNILAGLNGMGKSTLIQSLLLLRQSEKIEQGILRLNDGWVKIGTARDARSVQAEEDTISFGIEHAGKRFDWGFQASDNNDQIVDKRNHYPRSELDNIAIFNNHFQYISADRTAQQELHAISQSNIDRGFLGTRGEYAVHFLNNSTTIKPYQVPRKLWHTDDSPSGEISSQAEAWLGEISPGVRIKINQVTSELLKLGFTFDNLYAEPFKPSNVGFGISYSLAVIVALLTSQKGSLIIIENPEAHLHPRGQAKLAELICKAGRNGAQVIVETHSDHILNGIRVMNRAYFDDSKDTSMVGENRKGISNADVAIFWFERNQDASTHIVPIHIEPNARIKKGPAGFFDQIDYDLKKILGF